MSSRLPPESFFAPVTRPWVEPEKPKVRRRRIATGEQAAFNPVLTQEAVNGLNGHTVHEAIVLQEDELHNTVTRETSIEGPVSERFKRISVPPTKRKPTRKATGPTGEKWGWFVDDAAKRLEREDAGEGTAVWKGASSLTFVALYTILHAQVYGVGVTMSPNERVTAATMVKRLMKSKFSDDAEKFSWFFAWVWSDEAKRWAVAKGSKRMSWKWCFTNDKFDDWQASMRKKKERVKERELTDVGKVRV